jgi:hypothetical protein
MIVNHGSGHDLTSAPDATFDHGPRYISLIEILYQALGKNHKFSAGHRELAHTNESATRSWLVAPLGLEVVHLLWELAP